MLNLIQHLPRMPWPLRNGKRQTANNGAWKIPNQVWNDLINNKKVVMLIKTIRHAEVFLLSISLGPLAQGGHGFLLPYG